MNKTPKEQERTDVEIGEIVSKSEQFIEKNKKKIGYGLLILILCIGGFLAYKYLYSNPRESKASEEMFRAEHYFGVDSFAVALNGGKEKTVGFLEIIRKYGSTNAGNLAQAYAGICYYKLGMTDKAMEHLKKFKASDHMISPAITGMIGDCYIDLDQTKEGIKYFEKAAKDADNNLLSPIYLKKAGLAYEHLGEKEKALSCYQTIKDKYYGSEESVSVEKQIERLSLEK